MEAAGLFQGSGPVDPPEHRCDRTSPMIVTAKWGRNMALRTKLVAGNWKMNCLRDDGAALARGVAEQVSSGGLGCELLVCPPATLLSSISGMLAGTGVALGGQDCHAAAKGPYTGDISAEMLADLGCT